MCSSDLLKSLADEAVVVPPDRNGFLVDELLGCFEFLNDPFFNPLADPPCRGKAAILDTKGLRVVPVQFDKGKESGLPNPQDRFDVSSGYFAGFVTLHKIFDLFICEPFVDVFGHTLSFRFG